MSTRFHEVCIREFARHETFAPRFGWLRKAYDAVIDPEIGNEVFVQPNAPVLLGVGKNMVNAIRYWTQAFKLTTEYPKGGASRAMLARPTYRAYWLLDEHHGADPWLEDPGSLWLLHWWLLEAKCMAPAWWAAFHLTPGTRLVEQDLVRTVRGQVELAGWESVAETSLERDADVIAKMYAPRRANAASPGSGEDLLDCPFRDLGLLAGSDTPRVWNFTTGARSSLPPAVVLYAAAHFAIGGGGREGTHTSATVSVSRLSGAVGGPGRAFRLDEPRLIEMLERACVDSPGARMGELAGQRTLQFDREPTAVADAALDSHFRRDGGGDAMTRAEWEATVETTLMRSA